MNTNQSKNEYSSEAAIEQLLRRGSEQVRPSETLFRSVLASLPEKRIASPYSVRIRARIVVLKKVALPVLAILLVLGGGTAYIHQRSMSQQSANQSDVAVIAQLSDIDAQLGTLDTDNATIDQAFSHQTE